MQLANPLDDTTWDNDNTVYKNQWTFTYDVSQSKWDKIFGHKWMSFVWKSSRPKWIVLRPSLRK